MFDDLKQDNGLGDNQPSQNTNQPNSADSNVMPKTNSGRGAGGVDDMFDELDPIAKNNTITPSSGPVDPDKPSALQSGKMKPISQTDIPSGNTPNPEKPNFKNQSPVQVPQKMDVPNIPTSNTMSMSDDRTPGPMRKIIIGVLVIILLFIVAGGIYYFFLKGNDNQNTNVNSNQNVNTNTNDNQNTNVNINTDVSDNNPVINEDDLDDDFDGLSNGLEKIYGTNPLEADSDNDGVFDQDEIEVYKTDPLSDDSDNDGLSDHAEIIIYATDPNDPDTDGDTFSDGVEVENNYNPLGSGKLEDSQDQSSLDSNNNSNNNINTNENL